VAICYVGGEEVTRESFTLATDEKKSVDLKASTIYFEGFGTVPNIQKDNGKIAFVQIVYTVKNLYQRVDKAEVILQVNRNGTPLDQISMANLSPLEIGNAGLNYNYFPSGGWTNGSYEFQLQLMINGQPYTTSTKDQITVNDGIVATEVASVEPSKGSVASSSSSPASSGSNPFNPLLIGIIVIAVAALVISILLVSRKKKV
jgi:hypothetical protein